jgi:hypothetical protein
MASYAALLESKQAFVDTFWATLREAEAASGSENHAALSIQRVYRGTVSRERIAKKR